jgi:hypothetical protein
VLPSCDCTEEDSKKGPRKGPRKDVPTQVQIARPPAREHRGQREQRRTSIADEAVETASWAPIALTVLGGQAVVMLQGR